MAFSSKESEQQLKVLVENFQGTAEMIAARIFDGVEYVEGELRVVEGRREQ